MRKISLIVLFTLSCQFLLADITVSKTAEQLGTLYGWKTGNTYFYGTFQFDNVVTFCAEQPATDLKNGYYSSDSPRDWRVYQARNNGKFTISTRSGYILKSVGIVYGSYRDGVLSLKPGTELPEKDQIASGQLVAVNDTAVTFYAASTSSSATGQLRMSQFVITYALADSSALVEQFSQVDQTRCNESIETWQGDLMPWDVLRARRSVKDSLNGGVPATWTKSGGCLQMTQSIGGIKHLKFNWRQFVRKQTTLTMSLAAGTSWNDTLRMMAIDSFELSQNQLYDKEVLCKQNVQLAIQNISADSADDADRWLIGDLMITPYLFIPEEHRYTTIEQSVGSFDIRPLLLDNTNGEQQVVFSITSDATASATIQGSVLDVSSVVKEGDIVVRASCFDGQVFVETTVHVCVPEVSDPFIETFSRCTKTDYTSTTYVEGDQGVYGWNFTNFSRQPSDTMDANQAIRIRHKGSVMMNGVQEGGVKGVSFSFRAASAALPVKFKVWVDGEAYPVQYSFTQSMGKTLTYSSSFNITHNSSVGIELGANTSPEQSEILIGSVAVAPYLLFTQRVDTVDLQSSTSYAFADLLLDNTQGQGLITYSILSDDTQAAYLSDGVLYLDQVASNGWITLQAAWGDVTTSMRIYALFDATGFVLAPHSSLLTPPTKILRDGHLLIQNNGRTYTVLGI